MDWGLEKCSSKAKRLLIMAKKGSGKFEGDF